MAMVGKQRQWTRFVRNTSGDACVDLPSLYIAQQFGKTIESNQWGEHNDSDPSDFRKYQRNMDQKRKNNIRCFCQVIFAVSSGLLPLLIHWQTVVFQYHLGERKTASFGTSSILTKVATVRRSRRPSRVDSRS
jgi:hypothetical protein